jgi:hypothetical protein
MKKSKLFVSFLAVILFIAAGITANAQTKPNILANYPDGKIPSSVFVDAAGDSCSGAGLEQHDGSIHGNGYTQFTDSVRFVIKMHPPSYPWVYTNVCCAFTQNGGVPTHLYDIIVYDTLGAGGSPGNILQVIPGQNVTGIPNFPAYTWNSTTVSIPVSSTLGAIYIGYRYNNTAGAAFYVTADVVSPLWPGYGATNTTFPATWETIQTEGGGVFADYRCMAIRTMGHIDAPPSCTAGWLTLPVNTTNGYGVAGDIWIKTGPPDTPFVVLWGGNTTGATNGGTGILRMFNTISGVWTEFSDPLNLPRFIGGGSVVADTFFVGGGIATDGATYSNTWVGINLRTMTRVARANIPVAMGWFDGVTSRNRYVYLCGGYNGAAVLTTYVYDAVTGVWATGTGGAWTNSALQYGAACVQDSILVRIGGAGASTVTENWIGIIGATPTTITWTAGAPYPLGTGVYKPVVAADKNGKWVYSVGGSTSSGFQTGITNAYRYNPYTNTWETLASRTTRTGWSNGGVVRDSPNSVRFYSCNGQSDQFGPPFSDNERLCMATDTAILVGISNNNNNQVPNVYSLSQNYPNPFNPSTDIKFAISKAGFVKMVIYDVLGREVKTLVNEYRQAGVYNINFDASSYSSGVYFYRIEAGNFIQTKKMLLIK